MAEHTPEHFNAVAGRKVVSRASAEELGALSRLVIEVQTKKVRTLVLGKGRKARVVDWDALAGFGPDAVMVSDDASVREPADDYDKAAAAGTFELLGKRALTELGNELGPIDDVEFDPATGDVLTLICAGVAHPASTLLGLGSYAAVLDRSTDPT